METPCWRSTSPRPGSAADPLRSTIIDLVLERAATVAELAAAVKRPKSTVAHHVNVLVHAGERYEAEALLSRLLGLANDVGLYAEEAVPGTGEALGNFPQAFTHMALVSSCAQLSAVASVAWRPSPGKACDFAGFALECLLARRRGRDSGAPSLVSTRHLWPRPDAAAHD